MMVHVILRHGGIEYDYYQHFEDDLWLGQGGPLGCAEYMYEEGNYSCDCNKSMFIARYCDASFPEMDCGSEIELIAPRYPVLTAEERVLSSLGLDPALWDVEVLSLRELLAPEPEVVLKIGDGPPIWLVTWNS